MKFILFYAAIGLISGARGGNIAFTALLSKDTVVRAHAVVKYDHVLTNWGRAYQPKTGVFTAPYHGLYSISCSLMSQSNNSVLVQLVKNCKKMSKLYSNAKTFPHAGQTLQLLLNKGDRIWIENNNGYSAYFHDHGSYNVFSGFLISTL